MSYIKDFTTTYYFGNKKYKITAAARFDEKTNLPIYDAELDDRATEMARNAYRDDTGLIYPSEIKAFRDAAKLSQSDLAMLTGITVSTIALYEAGAFPIPKHNELLKNLISDDAFLKQTITDNSKGLPSELGSKILDYLHNHSIPLDLTMEDTELGQAIKDAKEGNFVGEYDSVESFVQALNDKAEDHR